MFRLFSISKPGKRFCTAARNVFLKLMYVLFSIPVGKLARFFLRRRFFKSIDCIADFLIGLMLQTVTAGKTSCCA